MISDGPKWYYLVVKNLSRLLRGITSNHKQDFYLDITLMSHLLLK